MKFVNTLIIDGQSYTLQDPNAVTRETFNTALGDVEAALEELHQYAVDLGGGEA